MTKSELKGIINECIEELLYENDDIELNEGMLFDRGKDYKKVMNDLKPKLKALYKSTFKDRLTGKVKKQDSKTIAAADKIMMNYFNKCNVCPNMVVVYVNNVEDHFERTYNCIYHNSAFTITLQFMFDSVSIGGVTSKELNDTTYGKDAVEIAIDNNHYGYGLSYGKDFIKFAKSSYTSASAKYNDIEGIADKIASRGYTTKFTKNIVTGSKIIISK